MCQNEKDDCEVCKALFDTCPHTTTFKNADEENECTFCGKIVPKEICPYCDTEYRTRTTQECSQRCMSR